MTRLTSRQAPASGLGRQADLLGKSGLEGHTWRTARELHRLAAVHFEKSHNGSTRPAVGDGP